MTTQHLSIRIGTDTLDRLDAESQRERISRSELARTLIEEGLRMQAHPGIVFRPGPAGRRPRLVAGPDVWQIIRARNEFPEGEEGIAEKLAEIASVTTREIRTVLDYYADYPEETDAWIRRVDEESERAYDEWKREQTQLSL